MATWLVVAVGGALGALARAGVNAGLPHPDPAAWPWSTFVVNIVGSFVIGLVLWLAINRYSHRRLLRPFIATGILGGFTTFSAFSGETIRLIEANAQWTALGYVVATLIVGVIAVQCGVFVASRGRP